MKKEELSSGAEKVERIAREKGGVFEDSAPGSEMQAAAGGSAQTKDESEALSERAESERERIQRMKEEREKQRAEKRLEIAKLKEEKKEKRACSLSKMSGRTQALPE